MEITTREGYEYSIRKHILPWFGPIRMVDILPDHVREWIKHLQTETKLGAGPVGHLAHPRKRRCRTPAGVQGMSSVAWTR
jgi:hypothetical protein